MERKQKHRYASRRRSETQGSVSPAYYKSWCEERQRNSGLFRWNRLPEKGRPKEEGAAAGEGGGKRARLRESNDTGVTPNPPTASSFFGLHKHLGPGHENRPETRRGGGLASLSLGPLGMEAKRGTEERPEDRSPLPSATDAVAPE